MYHRSVFAEPLSSQLTQLIYTTCMCSSVGSKQKMSNMFPLVALHTKIIIIIFGNVSFVFMVNINKNTGSYWMLNIII